MRNRGACGLIQLTIQGCVALAARLLARLDATYGLVPSKLAITVEGAIYVAFEDRGVSNRLRIEIDNDLDVVATLSREREIVDSGVFPSDEQRLVSAFSDDWRSRLLCKGRAVLGPLEFDGSDRLYRGFKAQHLLNGELDVNTLRLPDLSCNWARFSVPGDVRLRFGGTASDGCYSFTVEEARFEGFANVFHDPICGDVPEDEQNYSTWRFGNCSPGKVWTSLHQKGESWETISKRSWSDCDGELTLPIGL